MYEEKFIRFPEGKTKALAFSYDDGVSADARLISILDERGLKGTFNLNSARFDCPEWHGRLNEDEVKKLFVGCRHEIAMHGARHIFLNKVPIAEAVNEILQNRAYLEHMTGAIVGGFAYSYGAFDEKIVAVLPSLGVKYARTTAPTHGFKLPQDWLRFDPTCHHTDEEFKVLSDRFFSGSPTESAKERDGWLFALWGHSFEFDDNKNWGVIEEFCDRAKANERDVWSATCGDVFDYAQAYERLEFSLDGERVFNPSAQSVWLELRGKIYKIRGGETVKFDAV